MVTIWLGTLMILPARAAWVMRALASSLMARVASSSRFWPVMMARLKSGWAVAARKMAEVVMGVRPVACWTASPSIWDSMTPRAPRKAKPMSRFWAG